MLVVNFCRNLLPTSFLQLKSSHDLLYGDSSCERSIIGQFQRSDARPRRLRRNNHPAVFAIDNVAKSVAQSGECSLRSDPVHFDYDLLAPDPSALSVLHQEEWIQRRQHRI